MKTNYNLIFTIIFCLLFFIGRSQNNEWVKVGNEKNTTYYLRSVKSEESHLKKIWVKQVSVNLEARSSSNKVVNLPNGSSLTLFLFDCEERRVKIISQTFYQSNGKVFNSFKWADYEQEWDDIIPDSVGEMLLNKSCELF
jgi:hypothetical protein